MNQHQSAKEMLARRSELTLPEERVLLGHLQSCFECRETAAAYARQRELLRSLPQVDVPPMLRARVLREIGQPRPVATPWWRLRLPTFVLAPVAAALLVVVAALAFLNRPQSGTNTALVPVHRSTLPTAAAYSYSRSGPQQAGRSRYGQQHRVAKPTHGPARHLAPGVPLNQQGGVPDGSRIALGPVPTPATYPPVVGTRPGTGTGTGSLPPRSSTASNANPPAPVTGPTQILTGGGSYRGPFGKPHPPSPVPVNSSGTPHPVRATAVPAPPPFVVSTAPPTPTRAIAVSGFTPVSTPIVTAVLSTRPISATPTSGVILTQPQPQPTPTPTP